MVVRHPYVPEVPTNEKGTPPKGLKILALKMAQDKARIWPCLAYLCRIHPSTPHPNAVWWRVARTSRALKPLHPKHQTRNPSSEIRNPNQLIRPKSEILINRYARMQHGGATPVRAGRAHQREGNNLKSFQASCTENGSSQG